MPLISFFMRRFLTGAIARKTTQVLERRFKMSPAVASIAFMVITEVLARATEKRAPGKPSGGAKTGPGGRFGRRG